MTYELFSSCIERLKTDWPHAYGPEKQKALWAKLKHYSDEFMLDATEELIANRRAAPVLKDFLDHCDLFERRRLEQNRNQNLSMLQVLESKYNPANYNDPQVRERIKARLALVKKYTTGQISKEQFLQGCDFYNKLANIKS